MKSEYPRMLRDDKSKQPLKLGIFLMCSPLLSGGTAVNVLEAYVTENRHYVEATSGMMSGKSRIKIYARY